MIGHSPQIHQLKVQIIKITYLKIIDGPLPKKTKKMIIEGLLLFYGKLTFILWVEGGGEDGYDLICYFIECTSARSSHIGYGEGLMRDIRFVEKQIASPFLVLKMDRPILSIC